MALPDSSWLEAFVSRGTESNIFPMKTSTKAEWVLAIHYQLPDFPGMYVYIYFCIICTPEETILESLDINDAFTFKSADQAIALKRKLNLDENYQAKQL